MLPTYPFQRQRYWVDAPQLNPRTDGLRPLIDNKTWVPYQRQTIFEKIFNSDTLPFLADHQVYGEVVVPGACHLALALSVADVLREGAPCVVEDVIFPQALTLADGARTVQLLLDSETPSDNRSSAAFKIVSFREGELEKEPQLHCAGRLSWSVAVAPTLALSELRQRCANAIEPTVLYDTLAEIQIALGPTFRWFSSLWRGKDDEALGQMTMPDAVGSVKGYPLFPTLIDACLQLVGAAMMRDGEHERTVQLPFAVESLTLYGPTDHKNLWVYAQRVDENKWNITLFTATGQVVAQIIGFQVRAAEPSAIQGARLRADWLYQIAWQPLPLRDAPRSRSDDRTQITDNRQHSKTWLVFADANGLGEAVAQRLRADGASVTLVYPGATWQQVKPEHFVINPHRAEDYEQLMALLATLNQVVHLWSLNISTLNAERDLPQATQPGWGSALNLAQAVLKRQSKPTRLWLVTQNAQFVTAGDRVSGVAQTPLWGLGQVILQEYPELDCRLLDLDGETLADQTAQSLENTQLATLLCATLTSSQLIATKTEGRPETSL
ncbi:MAG: polyketide synthase dehydratase domain-containing protein, partial [Chloroflexota bacterium]|nr:polyketide synthase dehydratase domain-containing protein [Chloroflexota bacterium]